MPINLLLTLVEAAFLAVLTFNRRWFAAKGELKALVQPIALSDDEERSPMLLPSAPPWRYSDAILFASAPPRLGRDA